ncbi:MAG: heavy-metal-associated domain-containing protein [Nitrospirota bacterium]
MDKITLSLQKEFCDECSLALRRFIGKMNGVESIEVVDGKIEIQFDSSRITKENLLKVIEDSMEKLGYKILEWK